MRSVISTEGPKADIKAINNKILRAENEIKDKVNQLINNINNQVQTLPIATLTNENTKTSKYKIESLWDWDLGTSQTNNNQLEDNNQSNLK